MNNAETTNERGFKSANVGLENFGGPFVPLSLFLLSLVFLIVSFNEGLYHMVWNWSREEYSHGYMIPLVSLFLLAKKIPEITQVIPKSRSTHTGIVVLLISIALLILGELSSIYTIIQYGFLVALTGLFIVFIGIKGTSLVWAALVYLVFMIPLPTFLYNNLSSELQLISSNIGVFVIRLFDISVFLEGNVIDLGNYQLEVVEACSGLNYLFPLMSFGFLTAYLYQAPLWQRSIIFLSTVPITVLMNSFRIGVIGVTVNYWGIAAAEGFLHDFQGWVIFTACLGVLLIEIWVLGKITGLPGTISARLDVNLPDISKAHLEKICNKNYSSLIIFCVLSLSTIPIIYSMGDRQEIVPERLNFTTLPLFKGGWTGREEQLDMEILNELNVSDYMIANYQHIDGGLPVNFYIAYYDSQRKGASIHSPDSCIPGGGWRITEAEVKELNASENFSPINATDRLPPKVNRAIIEKGESRSLVYYWFKQRGRIITNGYLAKWYLFWDGLTINRTDGALIRVVTSVPDGMDIAEADHHLTSFLTEFNPLLADYIPD